MNAIFEQSSIEVISLIGCSCQKKLFKLKNYAKTITSNLQANDILSSFHPLSTCKPPLSCLVNDAYPDKMFLEIIGIINEVDS
ncbi:hypothetical protein JCM12294_30310 [Desulfocicer niacini]